MPHQAATSQPAAVPLPNLECVRMSQADDTIISVCLEVTTLSPSTCEIKVNGSTIGFIGRVPFGFTASAGTCPETATPRGQFDLWDKAAAALLRPPATSHHNGPRQMANGPSVVERPRRHTGQANHYRRVLCDQLERFLGAEKRIRDEDKDGAARTPMAMTATTCQWESPRQAGESPCASPARRTSAGCPG